MSKLRDVAQMVEGEECGQHVALRLHLQTHPLPLLTPSIPASLVSSIRLIPNLVSSPAYEPLYAAISLSSITFTSNSSWYSFARVPCRSQRLSVSWTVVVESERFFLRVPESIRHRLKSRSADLPPIVDPFVTSNPGFENSWVYHNTHHDG